MAEGLFWIFISFFAVVGLLEIFRIIQARICDKETRQNLLLIPIGEGSNTDVECRIHTTVFESLETEENMLVVDMGMDDKNREICTRLCEYYGIQISTPDNLLNVIKEICKKE